METCHDHEIAYWPDVGCQMCIAQAEIARLQAEVERLRCVVVKFGDGLRDAGMRLDTARSDALEEVKQACIDWYEDEDSMSCFEDIIDRMKRH